MPIVVDVNVFTSVFDTQSQDHADFAPVKEWIEKRHGLLVYGGTKFKEELIQSHRRAKLVRLLRDAGCAVEISTRVVDELEADVRRKTTGTKCNDPHIVALLGASRCPLLCSKDKESFPFIKDRQLYPKGCVRVKIYSGPQNAPLLKPNLKATVLNAV